MVIMHTYLHCDSGKKSARFRTALLTLFSYRKKRSVEEVDEK